MPTKKVKTKKVRTLNPKMKLIVTLAKKLHKKGEKFSVAIKAASTQLKKEGKI